VNDKAIKVLLIEDNPGDTRLIREMLKEAGAAQLELVCTDRLSTGLERLAEGGIDVILLDLELPGSQGLDTLGKVLAEPPEAPVIVVLTGLDDEALAIQAVRAGAQDYLVKGQVGGNLLARAMHYAIERKRAEEALQTQRDKFEGIIASLTDGLDIVSRDYRVHFQNKMLQDRFGDVIGKLCYEVYMARETPCESCPMVKAIATDSTQRLELTGADGREYEVTSTPFQDIDGETKVIEVVRDITERKWAEEVLRENEERYRQIFQFSPDSIVIHDMDMNIMAVNNKAVEKY